MQNFLIRCVVFSLAGMWLACSPFRAEAAQKHALLVGVSTYPALPARLQLKGPANDVALMRTVLRQNGFAERNIRMLADGIRGAGSPTRQAILGEMKRLASVAGSGDFIYLHFAGHGSQQPSAPGKQPPEPDGMDEIFLPADVGKWDGGKGRVRNAIVDTELGQAIAAIRQRGAFVWTVFDSCHSGSLIRGETEDVRYRQVRPHDLGITSGVLDKAQAGIGRMPSASQASAGVGALVEQAELKAVPGGFVAFFAAQSTEVTPEEVLPNHLPDRKPYGLFTYTLAETLSLNPGITYRQVGQQILNRYAAQARFAPTPLFEGSGLDAPVFGATPGEFRQQWKIRKTGQGLRIAAGALHQLTNGAIFAVVPSPMAEDKEALGYVKAVDAGTLETSLEPVEHNRMPAPAIGKIPGDAYARLVSRTPALGLIVALPPDGTDAAHVKARHVLKRLTKTQAGGPGIRWVQAAQGADLRLAIRDNRLWLLPPGGTIVQFGANKTSSFDLAVSEEKLGVALQASFQKIAKVMNLLRLSEDLSAGILAAAMQTTLWHRSAGETIKTEINPGSAPSFHAGDKLSFSLKNNHSRAVDVTVLFVDSEYGVSLVYPENPGDANRIEAHGGYDDLFEVTLNADTVGTERLIVIAAEAEPQQPMADFSFLAQPGLQREFQLRAAGSNVQEDRFGLFMEAGYGESTRGSDKPASAAIGKAAMRVFSWKTVN